jgi:hypothetical protein
MTVEKDLRLKRWWVNNTEMDLSGVGWSDMDWIDLSQDGDQWRSLVSMAVLGTS